jgi:hypothetical protein
MHNKISIGKLVAAAARDCLTYRNFTHSEVSARFVTATRLQTPFGDHYQRMNEAPVLDWLKKQQGVMRRA